MSCRGRCDVKVAMLWALKIASLYLIIVLSRRFSKTFGAISLNPTVSAQQFDSVVALRLRCQTRMCRISGDAWSKKLEANLRGAIGAMTKIISIYMSLIYRGGVSITESESTVFHLLSFLLMSQLVHDFFHQLFIKIWSSSNLAGMHRSSNGELRFLNLQP